MDPTLTIGTVKTGMAWIDMLTKLDGNLNIAVMCVTIMLSTIVIKKLKKAKKCNGYRWAVPIVMAMGLYCVWAYSVDQFSKVILWGGISTGAWSIFFASIFRSFAKSRKWKF